MPVLNHVHTFKRVQKNIYNCKDPHCSIVISKKLLLGKASRCNDCAEEIVLDSEKLHLSRPRCNNCRDTKASRLEKAAKDLMGSLGIGEG